MKVLILFKPNSDRARMVEEFSHQFTREHPGISVEKLSLDTKEGADKAALYDIVDHPGVLAVRDDGSVLSIWQGPQMPLMNEVASFNQ